MEVSNFKMKGITIGVKDATARGSIGNINELPTTDKSNVVNSIIELDAIIRSIQGSVFPVGHIIANKECDTEDKVIELYGGVHWRRIEDCFIGACGEILSINGGGSNTATLSVDNIPTHSHALSGTYTTTPTTASHTHSFTTNEQGAHTHYVSTNSNDNLVRAGGTGFGGTGGSVTVANASTTSTSSNGKHTHSGTTNSGGASHTHSVTLSGSTGQTGSTQPVSIIPSYEGSYVWVREE